MNKQSILSYIRRSNPELLELKFGCEVIKSEMWNGVVVGEAYEQVAYLNYDKMQVLLAPADQFEIIGSEVQLKHLLRAVFEKTSGTPHKMTDDNYVEFTDEEKKNTIWLLTRFDLSKSVEQNLDNPELAEFLTNLFNN